MDNLFTLPVSYNSTDCNFPAELITTAFSYRIGVTVFGELVLFEPDEEGNFRALINPDDAAAGMISKNLLEAIADQLMVLFRD